MHYAFHFHIIYLLAERSGFSKSEASTIAYASALPDFSVVAFQIEAGSRRYSLPVTQYYGWENERYDRSTWVPFHFFPGDYAAAKAARRDKLASRWAVTANSAPVRALIDAAIKSQNLMRIGIALHCYADSWAHQNFSGRNEVQNLLNPDSFLPPIGHAQAGTTPDSFGIDWLDNRLSDPVVSNTQRFLSAAQACYQCLTGLRPGQAAWSLVAQEISPLFAPSREPAVAVDWLAGRRTAVDENLIVRRLEKLGAVGPFDPMTWLSAPLEPASKLMLQLAGHQWTQRVLSAANVGPQLKAGAHFEDSLIWQWAQACNEHRLESDRLLRQLNLTQ